MYNSKEIERRPQFEKNFGRVLELKVGHFNLMLGSNLLVFQKDSQYPISL